MDSLKQGIPLTSTGKQVATPLILVSPNETGNVGTDDFRIVIVDKQAGESTIYFAIYDSDGTVLRAFGVYSKTGNYQAAPGSVLPNANIGEISCAKSDFVKACAIKDGYLQSGTNQYPTGGTAGTGRLDPPNARLP